jgi:hypothetical protein
MLRHWVAEPAPELDHPHADAACDEGNLNP